MSGEMILYNTEDGATVVQQKARDGSVWLSQAQIAELFEATKQNVSLHIRHILEEGELEEGAVVKEYLTTAADGKAYRTLHYSLSMILAIGFRVRSARGLTWGRGPRSDSQKPVPDARRLGRSWLRTSILRWKRSAHGSRQNMLPPTRFRR